MSYLRDRALVARALSGDAAAAERLVTEHYARVYRLLCHLSGDAETAKDLVQQTFVQAWQALGSFRGESSIATWLQRIAYRVYAHWLRSKERTAEPAPAWDEVDSHTEGQLEAVHVRDALGRLPDELRAVFILYHIQGLSIGEVALVVDSPPGTVRSRLFAARQRLREALSDDPLPTDQREGVCHGMRTD